MKVVHAYCFCGQRVSSQKMEDGKEEVTEVEISGGPCVGCDPSTRGSKIRHMPSGEQAERDQDSNWAKAKAAVEERERAEQDGPVSFAEFQHRKHVSSILKERRAAVEAGRAEDKERFSQWEGPRTLKLVGEFRGSGYSPVVVTSASMDDDLSSPDAKFVADEEYGEDQPRKKRKKGRMHKQRPGKYERRRARAEAKAATSS